MKLISSTVGVVGLRVNTDEVLPETGLVIEEMAKYVGDAYNFSVRPQLPRGVVPALLQPFLYQSGSAEVDGNKVPIFHLAVLSNGDIISAHTTEIADKIMNDYVERLDRDLRYRYSTAVTKKRMYASNVVFEFESAMAQKIER